MIERNDIYRWYLASLSQNQLSIKATLVYPCTETHIRKHSKQNRRMVQETPEIYKEHVEKYIQTMKGSRIQWLYNVLEHKAESENIIYEDPDPEMGFMLLPDLYSLRRAEVDGRKWDRVNLSSLYLSAILRRRDLSSIRDLNESHIPLLKKLRTAVIDATVQRWPEISPDQLRLYFHCTLSSRAMLMPDHPSYYHMHIHVVHTDFQGGEGMAVGKAWLLDDVIEQLSFLGQEGFKKKTITVIVGEESDLWKQIYSKISL